MLDICFVAAISDLERAKYFILAHEILLTSQKPIQVDLGKALKPLLESLSTPIEPYVLIIDLLRMALLQRIDCSALLA